MGWMLVRLVLSLAFVAVVLLVAARMAKKRGLGRGASLVEVLARQPLTRTSSVNVIRVADRVFLVGSTEQQISLLAEMDDEAVTDAMAVPVEAVDGTRAPTAITSAAPARGMVAGSVFDRSQWSAFLQSLREKTVRR
jgi:flagellar protein FliO/FliZ